MVLQTIYECAYHASGGLPSVDAAEGAVHVLTEMVVPLMVLWDSRLWPPEAEPLLPAMPITFT